ncbi:MAG: rhomboid family intramembrane serine protease, partial [Bacteroidota bacterium]|nr:rhomboid family intramembrane serine protease [Bacteroidota bacterium]
LIELFSVAGGSSSGIAHAAHLGGGVVGLIYLLYFYRGSSMKFFENTGFKDKFTSYTSANKRKQTPPVYSNGANSRNQNVTDAKYQDLSVTDYKKDIETQEKLNEDRLNALLDKVSEGGYQSLSEYERSELSQLSKKIRY